MFSARMLGAFVGMVASATAVACGSGTTATGSNSTSSGGNSGSTSTPSGGASTVVNTGGTSSGPTGGASNTGGSDIGAPTGGKAATAVSTGIAGQGGGSTSIVGTTATGGIVGTGGNKSSTGGTAATGGSSSATGGKTSTGGTSATTTGTGTRTDGPCDIYKAAGTACAAAYSMIRGLSKSYTGALYQVRAGSSASNTGSGGTGVKDIPMTQDGYADTSVQDAFCGGTVCTVSILYDQSGNGNNLTVAKKGLSAGGQYAASDDFESSATKGSLTVAGHKVYSLYMNAREGYRLASVGKNMPLKTAPEGIYELADGTHVGTTCCWDFGNVTTDPTKYHTMNTLFFGVAFWGKGAGSGPWFMADFEAGVWAGGSKNGDPGWGALDQDSPANTSNPSMKVPFAFGILKTTTTTYALRMADLQKATALTTAFNGALPKAMDNQGGIVLGVGGDNSNNSFGTFFEGAITAGAPSDATDAEILKNVQAAGYPK